MHPEYSSLSTVFNGKTTEVSDAALSGDKILREALALLAQGFRPIVLYPKGAVRQNGETASGKEPYGPSWGIKEVTPESLAEDVKHFTWKGLIPGLGLGLGAGRAPGDGWLVDIEGDGPRAEESLSSLLGGEETPTLGWDSARGLHRTFRGDPERIKGFGAALEKFDQKRPGQPCVYKFDGFPDLELRIGGIKADGVTVKQLQSVCPPTPTTEGKPREWGPFGTLADLPEAFYSSIESILAPPAPVAPPPVESKRESFFTDEVVNRADKYLKNALTRTVERLEAVEPGTRHDRQLKEAHSLAGYLHYHEQHGIGYSESELESALTSARMSGVEPGEPKTHDTIKDGIREGKARPRNLEPDDLHQSAIGVTRNGKHEANGHHLTNGSTATGDLDVEIIDRWPRPNPRAFHGIAGRFVEAANPHTESDPVAVLVQFLIMLGSLIGRTAYFAVGGDRHYLNEFVALVGLTATGRKGSSWSMVKTAARSIDQAWVNSRVAGGMVSGEGLIHHVRDPKFKVVEIKGKKGEPPTRETVLEDAGEPDKRLLVIETEMGRPLKAMNRDSNTLSDVLRQAWDGGDLATMAKHAGNRATGAHVSLICHVTQADVDKHMLASDSLNGFANRFLWFAVRRSKILPDGGDVEGPDFQREWEPIRDQLDLIVEFARSCGRMRRDPEATEIWRGIYGQLSAGKPGILGAILSRAEAHVTRLSCLYAVLDQSYIVRSEHMLAAIALWEYAEASARFVFGERLGDSDSEKLLVALRATPDGLSRTEITTKVFACHKNKAQVTALLAELLTLGEIHRAPKSESSTPGRKPEIWLAGRGESDDAK